MSPHHEYVHYRGQQNLNLTAVWQYDSCGTQGRPYDGVCLFIYGAYSTYYSGFARSFTTCRNCVICALLDHITTHTNHWSYYVTLLLISLRKRSSFSVLDATDKHNIYLGLFTKLFFARLVAIYSPWKIPRYSVYSMFPPTYISCDYCCVTFVSIFINLRHPRDFTSHTSRWGTLYICRTWYILKALCTWEFYVTWVDTYLENRTQKEE